jgi:hypothetical protein
MKKSVFPACAAAASVAIIGVSACTTTTTVTHPATPAPTGNAGAKESIKGIPFYKPSTTRTNTGDSATLTSSSSVTKVNDFYVNAVNSGGWTTVSKSTSQFHGNLTVKKAGQGATISVAPSGSGTLISISTYPTT